MNSDLQTIGEQRKPRSCHRLRSAVIGALEADAPIPAARNRWHGEPLLLLLCLLALGSGMTLAQGRELATAIEVSLRESTRGDQNGPQSRTARALTQTVSKIVRRVTESSPALPSIATDVESLGWPSEWRTQLDVPVRVRILLVRVALLDLPPPAC